MPTVRANGLDLAYDEQGDGPALLLVMGIGAQRILWPDGLVADLARRFRVVRFDNRDVGQSTWLRDAPVPRPLPALLRALAKLPVSAPYTLSDMAADTVGLLDALGIARAHVVGASMGGMIAQHLAIEHPERVATLTSLMSGPGSVRHMLGAPRALRALLRPPPRTRDEAMDSAEQLFSVIGGRIPGDVAGIRDRAARQFDVGSNPAGFARQWAALLASGSRLAALRGVRAPTLVVHGTDDPLVPPRAGRATARAIPGAELLMIDGMGHDLPPSTWPPIVERIVAHAA
ncbi:MAG: alpha/beta fold hydrolase [Myxococcota bacterium]